MVIMCWIFIFWVKEISLMWNSIVFYKIFLKYFIVFLLGNVGNVDVFICS